MKEVTIFAGIDGTGPYDEDEYKDGFSNSFVRHFTQQGSGGLSAYVRGPGSVGNSTQIRASVMYKYIKKNFLQQYERGNYLKIMLSGYSRGGVAACAAAKYLSEDSIPVHGLFLFDPVDRTVTLWGKDKVIPSNVSHVCRTQRKEETSSRESFGTSCVKFWDGRTVPTTYISTTHGGMGGCPWGDEGEAKYYTFDRSILQTMSGYPILDDGYYKSAPPGGKLDGTKGTRVHEGFGDGATTLSAAGEEVGHLAAKFYYTSMLASIRRKPACLKKLAKYEKSLAQKHRNRAIVQKHRRETAAGQNWASTKGQY